MAITIAGVTIVAAIYAHKATIFNKYNGALEEDAITFDGSVQPGDWIVASLTDSTKAIIVTNLDDMPAGVPVINSGRGTKTDVTVSDIKNISYDDIIKALTQDLVEVDGLDDYNGTGTNPFWQVVTIGTVEYVIPIRFTTERPLRVRFWQKIGYDDSGSTAEFTFTTSREVWLNGCSDMPINSETSLPVSPGTAVFYDNTYTAIDPITDIAAIVETDGLVRFWGDSVSAVNDLRAGQDRYIKSGIRCESAGGVQLHVEAITNTFTPQTSSQLATLNDIDFRMSTSGRYDQDYMHFHTYMQMSVVMTPPNTGIPVSVGGFTVSIYQIAAIIREATSISSTGTITYKNIDIPMGARVSYTPGAAGSVVPMCKSMLLYNKLDNAAFQNKRIPIRINSGGTTISVAEGGFSAYIPADTEAKAYIGGRWSTRRTIDAPFDLGSNGRAESYPPGTGTIYYLDIGNFSAYQIAEIFAMTDLTSETPVRIPIYLSLSYTESGTPVSTGFTLYLYLSMGSLTSAEYISHNEPPNQRDRVTNLKFKIKTLVYSGDDIAPGDITGNEVNRREVIPSETGGWTFTRTEARVVNQSPETYLEEIYEREDYVTASAGANTITLKVNDWLTREQFSRRAIAFQYSGGMGFALTEMFPFNVDNSFGSMASITYTEE